jgi:hypothetical protein
MVMVNGIKTIWPIAYMGQTADPYGPDWWTLRPKTADDRPSFEPIWSSLETIPIILGLISCLIYAIINIISGWYGLKAKP